MQILQRNTSTDTCKEARTGVRYVKLIRLVCMWEGANEANPSTGRDRRGNCRYGLVSQCGNAGGKFRPRDGNRASSDVRPTFGLANLEGILRYLPFRSQ